MKRMWKDDPRPETDSGLFFTDGECTVHLVE